MRSLDGPTGWQPSYTRSGKPAQIAVAVADRTVTTHVEHILAKLGIRSRTLAAVRAPRVGLCISRPLNGVH